MATAATGWACMHSTEIRSNTNTSVTIRVICYWQNSGWRYDINNVSAWVYCGGQSAQVLNAGSVDTSGIANTAAKQIGYADFTISKTHAAQSISCYAKITSSSSYVSGTKSSGASSVSVSAKPSYTISYNLNGGSGTFNNQVKWYDENAVLNTHTPTKAGHNFVRWNTNTSNTGTGYTPGQTYTTNAALTLYAIWTPHTYTVSYNLNGGSGTFAAQTKTYNVTLKLHTATPTRTNYNFKGWATTNGGSVVYAAGANYTNNSGVTLYAVWELAYVKPRITNFTANRCTSDGTISESGVYIKVTFNWATDKTVSAIQIQHKQQTQTSWTNSYNGAISASGTSGSVSAIVGQDGYSTETSYHIRAYVTDSGGTTYSTTVSIGTVKFPIDVKSGGTGVAIGKVAETANLFDVGWGAKFRGAIQATVSETIGTNLMFNANLDKVDLNTITSYGTGFYRCRYGCTNTPYNSGVENSHWYVLQNVWGVGTYAFQLASMVHGDVRLYHRTLVNGSWTQWRSLHEGPTGLYDNSSGTNGTITLTETAANFSKLDITYFYSGISRTTSIIAPNGKSVALDISLSISSVPRLQYKVVAISGTSITSSSAGYLAVSPGGSTGANASENNIYIIKVTGYR